MAELKFDKMEVDTKLAQEFLINHKKSIESMNSGNRIKFEGNIEYDQTNSKRMRLFACKLEENAELFAQLEWSIRGVPKEDTYRNIKLIAQNFKFQSYVDYKNISYFSEIIIKITESTPLFHLGLMALACENCNFIVQYCESTAAIFYLFATLLSQFNLKINYNNFEYVNNLKGNEYGDSDGCVAVISEKSDLESAVDTFLASPTSKVAQPWTLRRIFVQESVYDRFKKVLSWKCELKDSGNTKSEGDASSLSSHTFVYDHKVFLLDYAGSEDKIKETKQVILVEAYRTIKELLSFLKKYTPFSISLWNSDVSETNEITFAVNVPVVWVNDHANVDGPICISQSFYCQSSKTIVKIVKSKNDMEKIHEKWSKLSLEDRVKKIENCLIKYKLEAKYQFENLEKAVEQALCKVHVESNTFVKVEKGRMWVGVEIPNSVLLHSYADSDNDRLHLEVITNILRGNSMLWHPYLKTNFKTTLLEFFENEGLPVFEGKDILLYDISASLKSDIDNDVKATSFPHNNTRIICTSFGTIFAN